MAYCLMLVQLSLEITLIIMAIIVTATVPYFNCQRCLSKVQ